MLSFKTKAETLAALATRVKTCLVLPQVCFTVREWGESGQNIIEQIIQAFGSRSVIVRSSALSEDSSEASQAGKFLSVADVQGEEKIVNAIRDVAAAFSDGQKENQIFIQPYLSDLALCGVVFTMDPNTGGNYYIVNYDTAGSTDAVTSGTGKHLETYYQFRDTPDDILELLGQQPQTQGKATQLQLQKILLMAKELTRLFSNECLDIEFAMTKSSELYLLQVRPLIVKCAIADLTEQRILLNKTATFIRQSMQAHPYVLGRRSIYGVMPDWNPAEMIGIRPRPLALSLYRRLITDGVWAYQRNNYGYRNLRSCPLLLDFAGLPYIDTRVSFNSFIPKTIPDALSEKLANYYLDALEREPDKHDKVEFEIIFSCYTFDLKERMDVLLDKGFTDQEIACLQEALLDLTNGVIDMKEGLLIKDTGKIKVLASRQAILESSNLDIVSKIYWLIEDCSRYGTLPFAGLARAGFIAVQMLKSLVRKGVLSEDDYEDYMAGLHTVSSDMSHDLQTLSQNAFLCKYGHLRPGTYDILAKRYQDAPDIYLPKCTEQQKAKHDNTANSRGDFQLSLLQYAAIQRAMEEQGLKGDVLSLFQFIKTAIEGREFSKFIFTRSVSMILECLAQLGAEYGISREEMSYFDIREIDELYSSVDDIKQVLQDSIARGKSRFQTALGLTMPSVILSSADVYCFHLLDTVPNYITLQTVEAPLCQGVGNRDALKGKILLIAAADPGYDWIFSTGIRGFVTAYGGVNSHMAIRAGELGVPAAIGVGEKLYAQLQHAQMLRLDCANKHMEVLR